MSFISAVICSHNPRPHYLRRVLKALREQTLPLSEWELLLVDNASLPGLAGSVDLSWHPRGRHVHEPVLGLTPARLRGISESQGGVLVFVDDDNVLASSYLEEARRIARQYEQLGAWGGSAQPEFEVEPPAWTRPYWRNLAIREVQRDSWSRSAVPDRSTPNGAGLCVRRCVAQAYYRHLADSPLRRGLDRRGQALLSGGDVDLALTACDIGLAHGLFASLELIHLIPPERLTEEYLLKLREGAACSAHLLRLTRAPKSAAAIGTWSWRLNLIGDLARRWGRSRRFLLARVRGEQCAARIFAQAPENAPMEPSPAAHPRNCTAP